MHSETAQADSPRQILGAVAESAWFLLRQGSVAGQPLLAVEPPQGVEHHKI